MFMVGGPYDESVYTGGVITQNSSGIFKQIYPRVSIWERIGSLAPNIMSQTTIQYLEREASLLVLLKLVSLLTIPLLRKLALATASEPLFVAVSLDASLTIGITKSAPVLMDGKVAPAVVMWQMNVFPIFGKIHVLRVVA